MDFLDWLKVGEIIKKGNHLSTEGSAEILKIKAGMNTNRLPSALDDTLITFVLIDDILNIFCLPVVFCLPVLVFKNLLS